MWACCRSRVGTAGPSGAAVRFEGWDRAGNWTRTDAPCGSTAPPRLLDFVRTSGPHPAWPSDRVKFPPMTQHLSRSLTLFGRALRLRCPNCGQGKPFESWLRMRRQCEVCGLAFERGEDGYQVGSYMFNIVASELVFAAA